MTPQAALDHIKTLIEAERNGESLQYKGPLDSEWAGTVGILSNSHNLTTAINHPERYRISRKPVARPWSKPSDVPGPVCWVRWHEDNSAWMVAHVCPQGFTTTHSTFQPWDNLRRAEHSTDRKTWHPCTVTE